MVKRISELRSVVGMKRISTVDEYDNWSPDTPLSWHFTQKPVEKNQKNLPEELQDK